MTALASASAPAFSSLPVDSGRFSADIAGGTAIWSDSVYHLHGYHPGEITPSGALTFHSKHPDDLHSCVDALHAGMFTNRLIVHEHRLIDASGNVRPVVMVARPVTDGQGAAQRLFGFLLPTDVSWKSADDPTRRRGAAPLIPLLMDSFGVSDPAARVLLAARRPLAAWRTPEQAAFTQACSGPGYDLRRTLEDSMFPLAHLMLEPVELAA